MNDSPAIEVYTQPHCAPCEQVMGFLTERGVEFVKRDVLADPAALGEIADRGFMTTPVTRVGERWIPGLNRRELELAILEISDTPGPRCHDA